MNSRAKPIRPHFQIRAPANIKKADTLSKSLTVSVGLHFVLGVLLIFKAVFYPSVPIQFQHAIRIDMVALPDKSLTSLPKPIEIPEPKDKIEPKPSESAKPVLPQPPVKVPTLDPTKIDLRKSKKIEDSAMQRLEALKRLEQMQRQSKAPVFKGNVLSAGSSVTGINKLDNDAYIDNLDTLVKSHWNLPRWLATANLKTSIVMYIDANGNVTKRELRKSSGNAVFDEKCMEAIEQAVPFPPPPQRLVNIFLVDGVVLNFSPEDASH